MRYLLSAIAAVILTFSCAASCFAQAALNATPEDAVYHAIDIFIANGLANDVIIGQRPYSRLEVARILKQVRRGLDERRQEPNDPDEITTDAYLERLLAYYEKDYARELGGMKGGSGGVPALSIRYFT